MTDRQILKSNIYTATRDPRNSDFNHLTKTKALNDKGDPVIRVKLTGGKYWVRLNDHTKPVFEDRGSDLSIFN